MKNLNQIDSIMKIFILFMLWIPLVSFGQEELPKKYMRFVPLGQYPPWKEEMRDGRRIQSLPEPGQMPPPQIQVTGGTCSGPITNLYLRMLTHYFLVSGEQERLEISEEAGMPLWISHLMPTAPHTLAILFRDHEEMTWLKPLVKIVKDDLETFPTGLMRLVNVSQIEVSAQVGEDVPVFIKPGESGFLSLKKGRNLIRVNAIGLGGETSLLYQNVIPMKEGWRIQSFVFKSQKTTSTRPVRFTYQIDPFKDPRSLFKSREKPQPKPDEPVVEGEES